jgi:hypothetical protein
MGTGSFSGAESGRGVTLTLTPFQKQSRATPLFSLRAFVACKKGETYLINLTSLIVSVMAYKFRTPLQHTLERFIKLQHIKRSSFLEAQRIYAIGK